jgi:uncharacterized phage protein (TIGR01671 family)
MKRELKFRIWAHIDKAFIYFDIDEYPSGIAGGVSEPQQYTGLKDKRGLKIYEGDIVLDPTANGGKYKEVMQNDSGQWVLDYKTPEIKNEDFTYYDDLFSRINYCEIAGNVFENGDLIK